MNFISLSSVADLSLSYPSHVLRFWTRQSMSVFPFHRRIGASEPRPTENRNICPKTPRTELIVKKRDRLRRSQGGLGEFTLLWRKK